MTVTKPRNYYFRYIAACHRLKRCDSQFAARKRDDFRSFRSRDMKENYYWKMFEFSNDIFNDFKEFDSNGVIPRFVIILASI